MLLQLVGGNIRTPWRCTRCHEEIPPWERPEAHVCPKPPPKKRKPPKKARGAK